MSDQSNRKSMQSEEGVIGAYHWRLPLSGKVVKPESERIRQCTGRDDLPSSATDFGLHFPRAEPSGISRSQHVAEAVHSALQGKNPSVKPGRNQVGGEESLSLQLGDPGGLSVDVAIASAVLQSPLMLLNRPGE